MTPDTLKTRVLESVRQHPSPPRTEGAPAIALAAGAAAAMLAIVQWVPPLFGERGGIAHVLGRPSFATVGVIGGVAALAVLATVLVLPGRRSMLAPARGVLVALAVAIPLLVGGWLVLWHGAYEDPFTRVGFRCFALTMLTAPWPFAALVAVSRRVEPRYPATVGAALGATGGAWAAVMVELWCPLAATSHVAIGHVLPLAVLVLAGAALGRWIFRRSPVAG